MTPTRWRQGAENEPNKRRSLPNPIPNFKVENRGIGEVNRQLRLLFSGVNQFFVDHKSTTSSSSVVPVL